MPPWWRYAEPFFRKLHASDLARVLPTRPWDDDPDLRAPPAGRSYAEPFEDGLPVPKLPEPPAATAAIATGPIAATATATAAAAAAAAATATTTAAATTAASTSATDASGTAAAGGASSLAGAAMPPPPPAAPAAFAPPPAPIVVPPSGVSVGEDLLDAATPDEVASLARQMLAFDDDRPAALAAAAESAGKSERAYEDWLVGRGLGRRGEREDDDVAKGTRRWLRAVAAAATLDARDARRASNKPLESEAEKAAAAAAAAGGLGGVAGAKVPAPRFPHPAPEVAPVIKVDDAMVPYVAGEIPGAPGTVPPPGASLAAAAAGAVGGLGGLVGGAARALGRLSSGTSAQASREGTPASGGSSGSLSRLGGAKGEPIESGVGVGPGPSGLGPGAGAVKTEETEEERAAREAKATTRRAFGGKGDLPHLFGPSRADERTPLHTEMLLERSFWLASSVGALPSVPPPTPFQSPTPAKHRDAVSGKSGKTAAAARGRDGADAGNAGGRCSVCVVQKKGRCGTETAPLRCLRRGGPGGYRAGSLEDPFDETDTDDAAPEPAAAAAAAGGAKSDVKAEPSATVAEPPAAPARRPPPTPLPAASTAAVAAMRAAERKKKRADARAAKRAKEGAANEGGDGDGDGDGDSDSDSDSESVSAPASAKAELSRLIAALDADPALRAAAPADEVEGELLALQYELLWQSQANRHVLASTLRRVADAADEEGERHAETEGEHAEAAAYMSKVREVRRMIKREKREADQRAALERAAAAAAASSRVGAQRRDADGNVIAPAMGALDGLPPEVAAAAAAAAEAERLGGGGGGANAATPSPTRPYRSLARPKIPKHVLDRFKDRPPGPRPPPSPMRVSPQGFAGGVVPPGYPGGGGAYPVAAGAAGVYPGAVSPVAEPPSPAFAAPPSAVLVDTVHAAAAAGGGRDPSECAVCAGTADVAFTRETLRCERCALPVHPRCYGLQSAAAGGEGWTCWVCRDATEKGKANTPAVLAARATAPPGSVKPSSEEKLAMYRGVSCILCPVQLGAFKQCTDGRWCHVACAQWMPEISIRDVDEPQTIRGVQQMPRERARQPCVACGRAAGVSMRCSYGHCQTAFHPLCARQAGLHVRASDGAKPHYRAYCEKHSQAHAERDAARGVPRARVPPPPNMAPVTMPGRVGGVGMGGIPAGSSLAASRAAAIAANPAAARMRPEEAEAIRRLRVDLQRARSVCKAVLRRESVKRGIARVEFALRHTRMGGELAGAGGEFPGTSPTGLSGVTPVAPKRARSGPTKGKRRADVGGGGAGGGAPTSVSGADSETTEGGGRWPKRARRSGGSGSVLRSGGDAEMTEAEADSLTPVSRERYLSRREAGETNARLPPGWAYVPKAETECHEG